MTTAQPTVLPERVLALVVQTETRKQSALLALVLCSIALNVVPVHLLRVLIDDVIPSRSASRLGPIVAVLVGAAVVRVAVEYAKTMMAESVRQSVIARLRAVLHHHILRLSPAFFSARPVGELLNRVQNDTGRLGMSVGWIFVEPLVEGTTLALYASYLLWMDPRLLGLGLLLVPVAAVVAPGLNRSISAAAKGFTARQSAYGARLQETYSAVAEVQAHGTWRFEEARAGTAQDAMMASWMQVTRGNAGLSALSDLSRGVGPVMVYAAGALIAVRDGAPPGQLVAFAGLLGGLYGAFDKLLKYPPQLRVAQDRYDELRALLAEPTHYLDGLVTEPVPGATYALSLELVSFGHEAGKLTVDELTLGVRAGEHVALVGRSGSGKSTALGLFAGKLRPQRGEVLVEGIPIERRSLASRAALIGLVIQNASVFAGTLRDNLLYALLRSERGGDEARSWLAPGLSAKDVSDEALLACCEDVGLGDELVDFGLEASVKFDERFEPVRRALLSASVRWDESRSLRDNLLPDGWDSGDPEADAQALARLRAAINHSGLRARVRALALDRDVGERGARLSGGQRQKVALARVLMKAPGVLLLDEVTASMDDASARRIVALVRERFRGRTVVAVTHDTSSLDAFDRVVLFDGGRVAAQGSFAELRLTDGPLRALLGVTDE